MMFITNVFCQDNTPVLAEADWQKIIPHLQNEQWGEVEKISGDYLKKFKKSNEDTDEAAIVRYMYLCSVAGQLGDKQIDKDEALKKVKGLKGKTIVTPVCTFKKKGLFNFFSYSEEQKKWNKCFANKTNTAIYLFEYYDMKDKDLLKEENMNQIEGKNLRLSGTIKDITAEGYAMPRLKVDFADADIWDMIEE